MLIRASVRHCFGFFQSFRHSQARNTSSKTGSAEYPRLCLQVDARLLWPATFVVNAADQTPIKPDNLLAKYVDDTYLIVPASYVDRRPLELDNIEK